MWKFTMVLCLLALVGKEITSRPPTMKNDLDQMRDLQNQLQRGPVPPSQPSLCHNRVNTLSHPEDYYSKLYVLCP
ncbi:unnamed protein product [Cochlearia groenlandica]